MDRSRLDDANLVQRVLDGDSESFAQLFRRYADALSALVFLKLRNSADAQDIVQQAFFTAYQKLEGLAEPGKFGPWLKGIALRLCGRLVEKRARRERLFDRLPSPLAVPGPADELLMRERTREILAALDRLDDAHAEIVALFYMEEMSVRDVARTVGRPPGLAKSTFYGTTRFPTTPYMALQLNSRTGSGWNAERHATEGSANSVVPTRSCLRPTPVRPAPWTEHCPKV